MYADPQMDTLTSMGGSVLFTSPFGWYNEANHLIAYWCEVLGVWNFSAAWLTFWNSAHLYFFRLLLDHSWLQNAKKAPNAPLGDMVRTRLKQFSVMNKFKKKALRVRI